MDYINVKLRLVGKGNKFRRMLSTDSNIYPAASAIVQSSVKYRPDTLLEDDEWFRIEKFAIQTYAITPIIDGYETVDYATLEKADFDKIDYLLVESGEAIFFQNVSKAKLVAKKRVVHFGEAYEYKNDSKELVINDIPDAIYCGNTDTLYFRKLETITSIFNGIDQLYREATENETELFLQNSFIHLKGDYNASKVQKANRKRIALAVRVLSELADESKKDLFEYIGDYCPGLKTDDNAFEIGNEEELKLLLYGIEQRFYTTSITNEKRIANSVKMFE